MVTILFYAASRVTSLYDACQRLVNAPTDEAMRQALSATLPPINKLERQLNNALGVDLPKALRKRPQLLAIDLTLIPYHGRPCVSENEIYRGEPKSGTSHFHAYATAYVIRKGHRFTVAMTYVLAGDPMKEVIQRLLQNASRHGVKPRILLMDRGFHSVEVIRYLQRARYPFIMPTAKRGRKPAKPNAQSIWRFFNSKRSGWGRHTWTGPRGEKATAQICVACGNFRGKWGRQHRRTFVYSYWNIPSHSCEWFRETYRSRFAIETTYRQMNEARINTCTRDPLLRLLFVGMALILRNVWVWLHLTCLAKYVGRKLVLHLERLRFRRMLLWLQHHAESLFGIEDFTVAQLPMPP
jgi:putative transposase